MTFRVRGLLLEQPVELVWMDGQVLAADDASQAASEFIAKCAALSGEDLADPETAGLIIRQVLKRVTAVEGEIPHSLTEYRARVRVRK